MIVLFANKIIFRVIRCLGAGFNYEPAASGVRSAWVWGNLNNGSNAGLACRNSNNGVGNTNWNGSLGATGTILKRVFKNHCIVESSLMCENNLKPTRLVPIRESHGSNQMNIKEV